MKKPLLVFFFSILFLNSRAQTSVYYPFPDSDAIWCSNGSVTDGLCPFNPRTTNSTFQLAGNTTVSINGKNYHILYRHSVFSDWSINNCDSPDVSIDADPYYIRQDTALKKVWIYDGSIDTILVDFNLHVGDTLDGSKVYWGQSLNETHTVTSIDSIFINGNYRKRYNFRSICSSPDDTCIIEGIGSVSGLLTYPGCWVDHYILSGFAQDGKVLYGSFCQSILDVQNIGSISSIKIFPNPASDKITISGYHSSGKEMMVEIYNMIGEKVCSVFYELRINNYELNISSLSAGVYIVQLSDGEKTVRSKFIKQ